MAGGWAVRDNTSASDVLLHAAAFDFDRGITHNVEFAHLETAHMALFERRAQLLPTRRTGSVCIVSAAIALVVASGTVGFAEEHER